ncbi:MAG: ROK family transcriptional regulator [Verrucomicrobiia bacterium]
MGLINKQTLIYRLQRMGAASRAELAKELGLSQPTVGKIANQLLKQGVIEVVRSAKSFKAEKEEEEPVKIGRPGILLRLNRKDPRFLCIQLGVDETCLAASPIGIDSEDKWQIRVPTTDSAQGWLKQLKAAEQQLQQKNFWGILVSVPGIVDEASEKVIFSPNLHWTEKVNLPSIIKQVWDAPVVLLQEVRALALGHQSLEGENEDFFMIEFCEGVGGAAVVNGKLYTNRLPISGEIGHTPIRGNQRKCGCGAVGCLETLVSTRGLLTSFSEATGKKSPVWSDLVSHVKAHGIEPWLDDSLESAAAVIAGAINVMGMRKVVVIGGLVDLGEAVIKTLEQKIIRGAMWARFGTVQCIGAPRRRIAGLVWVGIERLVAPVGIMRPAGNSHF